MRVGILGLLHESNTFAQQPTTLEHFQQDLFLLGDTVAQQLHQSHHEIGGFFAGLADSRVPVTPVPLAAFRATPAGPLTAATIDRLVNQVLDAVHRAMPLDGLLLAAHGAAVSENFPDADGHWMAAVRQAVGPDLPIVATLDAHANLTPTMVSQCDALISYRTNPHLDQRDRGREAAQLLLATLRGHVHPTMAAVFLPLVINIDRQCTEEAHLRPPYQAAQRMRADPHVLSNSILLGFPYADVWELGASTLVVTDNNLPLADERAAELAGHLWAHRAALQGQLRSVDEALAFSRTISDGPVCLLDMGDNVGGGSAADGTVLPHAVAEADMGSSFSILYDPESVAQCATAGVGAELDLQMGGKTDRLHGPPWPVRARVLQLADGTFTETEPRHGGIVEFDQGRTAIVRTQFGQATIMLTSQRVPPFSLSQLTSFDIDPSAFNFLIAKGVNAPLAAYRPVCSHFLRVNTTGATCADLSQLAFRNRRRPLFPFEQNTPWPTVAQEPEPR